MKIARSKVEIRAGKALCVDKDFDDIAVVLLAIVLLLLHEIDSIRWQVRQIKNPKFETKGHRKLTPLSCTSNSRSLHGLKHKLS